MTVKVEFPDGTIRDVPSRTVRLPSNEVVSPGPHYIEEPAYDPKWQFHQLGGEMWMATPR